MRISKLLMCLLASFLMGSVSCSASKSSDSSDSIDSMSSENSEATDQPQGILKAFGLKGQVKTLMIGENEEYDIYAFDPDGNYIKDPNSSSGTTSMMSGGPTGSLTLKVENGKWVIMYFESRWSEASYDMTSYDSQNRPATAVVNSNGVAMDEVVDKAVKVVYSGSDSHGNYTKIVFTDSNGEPVPSPCSTLDVKIEYWPEGATAADLPTELTKKMAESIIRKANAKDKSALSKVFWTVVDRLDHLPGIATDWDKFPDEDAFYFSDENSKVNIINGDHEYNYYPEITILIKELNIGDSGDRATVKFEEVPPYGYQFMLVDFVYEDGAWKVDDFGYKLNMYDGFEFAEESYKEDLNKELENKLKDLKSGKTEKEIRESFPNDSKLPVYLKKVEDYKKKYNIK